MDLHARSRKTRWVWQLGRLALGGTRRSVVIVALLAAVAALAAGCGSPEPTPTSTSVPTPTQMPATVAAPDVTPTSAPTPTSATVRVPDPTPTPAPTPTPDPLVAFQPEWDELIAAAQAEGDLVVVGTGSAGFMAQFYDHFEEKFGINTTLSSGGSSEQANRMLAEQASGRYEVDLVTAGNSTIRRRLGPTALEPIPPWLVHPEVIDESLWYEGQHKYADPETQTSFVFSARATAPQPAGGGMSLWYNTNRVSPEEIAAIETPWDFLQDKWKGQIVTRPVWDGGGGTGVLINMWQDPNLGEPYLRALWLDMEPFVSADVRHIETSLIQGAFAWSFSAGIDAFPELRDSGAPISQEFPKALIHRPELDGGGTTGSQSIAKNPPHPNATKLYLNWWLSKEGQTLMQASPGRPPRGSFVSLREDVPPGTTDPAERRVPGQEYEWEADLNPETADLRFTLLNWLAELMGREPVFDAP